MIKLFDYKDINGYNVIKEWVKSNLQPKDRARLDNRVDILERIEESLPPGLLHKTSSKTNQIFHLVVRGKVTICPMLCRGTVDFKKEFTFLFGATERDRKYNPKDAPHRAEANRQILILNANCRCKHERFT